MLQPFIRQSADLMSPKDSHFLDVKARKTLLLEVTKCCLQHLLNMAITRGKASGNPVKEVKL
jgi:hypothetical protein